MMHFFGWCVCLIISPSPPPLSKRGGGGGELESIWFSSMCENRDVNSGFVPLMLFGSVMYVLD